MPKLAPTIALALGLVLCFLWPPELSHAQTGAESRPLTLASNHQEQFAVTPVDWVMWATTRANVRSGPGTDHRKMGTLEAGERVLVTGTLGDWLRITGPGGPTAFVYAPLLSTTKPAESSEPPSFHPSLAVWRIHNRRGTVGGTAFAIGPSMFMTVAHVVKDLSDAQSERIFLSWKDTDTRIRLKRLVAVSTTYDLALFETDKRVKYYLPFADSFIPDHAKGLYAIGYAKGSYQRLQQTEPITFGDLQSYAIPMNSRVVPGFSGSPVLNAKGKVVAILEGGVTNMARGVRLANVKSFMTGNLGVRCSGPSLLLCVGKGISKTESLARHGNSLAQYELAHEFKSGMEPSELIDLLSRSVEGGHAKSGEYLGSIYAQGERGVEQSYENSAYWYHRAAQLGDPWSRYQMFFVHNEGRDKFPQDDSLALAFLREAAETGYMTAQYNLGVSYDNGWLGLKTNRERATYWYRKAAAKGHENAQDILAERLQ